MFIGLDVENQWNNIESEEKQVHYIVEYEGEVIYDDADDFDSFFFINKSDLLNSAGQTE